MDEVGPSQASNKDVEAIRRRPRRRRDQLPNTRLGRFKKWSGLEGKTPFDVLSVVLVPVMITLFGTIISFAQYKGQQAAEDQRAQSSALQAYLDQMGQWLIEQDLEKAQQTADVAKVGRARTLTILGGSDDPVIKRRVIQFLHETDLISKGTQPGGEPPISMTGADLRETDLYIARQSSTNLSGTDLSNDVLSGVDLSRSDMRDANLRSTDLSYTALIDTDLSNSDLNNANLTGADLTGTNLDNANLIGANLSKAIVTDEQLERCKSLEGATMPDGSKHS